VKSLDSLIDTAEELGYPNKAVVVKPPVSFGSRGFRVLRENTSWSVRRFLSEKPDATEISLDDLSKILTRDAAVEFPPLLVTEYLPGNEYSVDAFIGEKVAVAIPRLRKQIVNGISFRTSLEYRRDVTDYTLRAGKELGLKYAFGFQFKLDYADVPKILECNPRVQGTMVASVFSGVNVIWMAVREAIGAPLDRLSDTLKKSDFYRFWGGIGVSESSIEEI
jgi:carbamoyl-phosphate synthase large subunit